MMRKILILLALGFLIPSCSLMRQQQEEERLLQQLPVDEPLIFYMQSASGRRVPMHAMPAKRAELIRRLNQLAEIEKRAKRKQPSIEESVDPPMPSYSYELVCETCPAPGEQPARMRFKVRRSTYIGGDTVYEWNAARYFTRASWRNVNRKLHGKEERKADRLSRGKGAPLP